MLFFCAEATRRNISRMSLCVRLFLGSLVILAGFLFVAPGARAQISPGPLSKAHESLNGSTQCNTCHQFGTARRRSNVSNVIRKLRTASARIRATTRFSG